MDLRSTYEKESAKAMGIKDETKLKWSTMNEKLRSYPNFNYLPVNDQTMMTEVMIHLCEDANSDYTFVDELIQNMTHFFRAQDDQLIATYAQRRVSDYTQDEW